MQDLDSGRVDGSEVRVTLSLCNRSRDWGVAYERETTVIMGNIFRRLVRDERVKPV